MYCARTGVCVKKFSGHSDIVNVAVMHPYLPLLATSGIESDIRLWMYKDVCPGDVGDSDSSDSSDSDDEHWRRADNEFLDIDDDDDYDSYDSDIAAGYDEEFGQRVW